MRNIRRWPIAACVGLISVLTALGCGSNEKSTAPPVKPGKGSASSNAEKRIIILTNGESPFWDAARQGMEAAEKDLKLADSGLKAVLEVNNRDEEGQLDQLRQYVSQTDIAAVGISVTKENNVAIVDQLRQLRKNGVHVITLDSDVNRAKFRDARVAYVGTDNMQAGRELGRVAQLLRPEGGEYVTFVGFTTAQNAVERVQGFKEGAGPKFVPKDNMGDDTDRPRAKENVRNALINHPKLNVLVGIWSYNAPAIVGVLEEQKRREGLTVLTFDAEPIAIQKMQEGWIDAMVVQNPYEMGYQGTRMMKALVTDDQKTVKEMFPHLGEANGDLFDTGIKMVLPDKASPLKPDMFDNKEKNMKGYSFGQFKEWLAKYDLKGS